MIFAWILILNCIPEFASGQNYYGDIHLVNQSQVDSFPINFPVITNVIGNVTIENAQDLDSLYSIEVIEGIFILGGDFINLNGLHNLREVDQIFEIYSSNAGFQNLTGLSSLESCLQIRLYGLEYFENFSGLNPNMTNLESIMIQNCHFINFDGISPDVNPQFVNIIHSSVENFMGLDHIDSLAVLAIQTNSTVQSYLGLGALIHIGYFFINESYVPENFIDLQNITDITEVEFNFSYQTISLSGLENLDPSKLISVNIWGSEFCTYDWLCEYFTQNPGGGSLIGIGSCASVSALLQSCTTFTYSGTGNWNNSGNWSPTYPGFTIENATIFVEGNVSILPNDIIQCINCLIIIEDSGSMVNNGVLNIID